nr:hypothetical protein [Tanacetum cinerariifolium]
QIETDRLQDSLQQENDEFLRNINENIKKIIKGQVKNQVKEQVSRILPRIEESVNATLEAEVLTRSSHLSRTSYAIAADLSEMELKKILIESTILKRRREDDDQEGPSAGSNRGSKRQKEGGEHPSASTPSEKAIEGAGRSTTRSQSRQMSASESAFAEEPMQTTCQMEETPHLVFETGADDQPIVQTSKHHEWFSQPRRPPSPDHAWNTTLPAAHGDAQSWISDLARQTDARSSFNELLDTSIDFSNFIMHRLNIDTLTLDLLAGPTYELMRGSCTSLTELEYHLEEPLPLISNHRGRQVIPFEHFINNDLEYLRGGALSRKYTTFVTKTKAADYGHIKWIEDLVPREMWIKQPIDYNKHALWGVSHWGQKRKQFYGYAVNRESARDVYSKRRIIAVTELQIMEWHDYKHLDWISGVVIRLEGLWMDKMAGNEVLYSWPEFLVSEDAQFEEVRRKSMRDFHKTPPSGFGTVTKTAPSVAKIQPLVTSEGTGVKPGVLDVTEEESSESSSVESGTVVSLEEDSFLNFPTFLGGVAPVAKPSVNQIVIPEGVHPNLVSPGEYLVLSKEIVNDNFGESWVVHLLLIFVGFVVNLVNEIFPK